MSTPRITLARAALLRLLGTAGLAAAGLLLLSPAPPAAAHATFTGSTPSQDDVLDALPEQISLSFSEDMLEPAYVVVTAPDGQQVTEGEAVVTGPEVTQQLTQPPTESLGTEAGGSYTVGYRVVSTDGHPVTGELTFDVATTPGAGQGSQGGQNDEDDDTHEGMDHEGMDHEGMDHEGMGHDGGAAEPASTPESTQTAAASTGSESFWARHDGHIVVGAVLFLLAAGLLLASRRTS